MSQQRESLESGGDTTKTDELLDALSKVVGNNNSGSSNTSFSCFLCKKRCWSKDRLLSHFCTHFKRRTQSRLKRKMLINVRGGGSSDHEGDEEDSEGDIEAETATKPKRRKIRGNKNGTNRCVWSLWTQSGTLNSDVGHVQDSIFFN